MRESRGFSSAANWCFVCGHAAKNFVTMKHRRLFLQVYLCEGECITTFEENGIKSMKGAARIAATAMHELTRSHVAAVRRTRSKLPPKPGFGKDEGHDRN